jgi:protein ImuB
MSRIVSVWLPRWPIQRFLAAQALANQVTPSSAPIDPEQPFVLAIATTGGLHIVALNEAAEDCGLAVGEPVADARAKAGLLQMRPVDAAADDAALRRVALWATRYTPTASPWNEDNGADGFFLDVEGAAHLFGGEEKLIADLAARLKKFGLAARLAVAATPGAAWALSHFHDKPLLVLPPGEEASALAALPVDALRLSPDTRSTLRRLGFKTVGALLNRPRAPFAARFAAELLRRLDQALGRSEEPLVPIVAPPVYHSLNYLLEPIVTQDAILARAGRLMQSLAKVLQRDDVGARALRLTLYRVDGAVESIDIALTLPTRSVDHVARLLALKLEAMASRGVDFFDAGFGFEAIGLAITRAEPMPAQQIALKAASHPSPACGGGPGWGQDAADAAEDYAALIDALRQRLGPHRVRRFAPVDSHIPESAETLVPAGNKEAAWPLADNRPRPLLLLPQAEPTKVTALVPDGPPRRFSWRGVTYDITGAQGPERIGSEWWRDLSAYSRVSGNSELTPCNEAPHRGNERRALTRDYYLVEDSAGHRFWLYREGLYGRETKQTRWYVHGLFA